MRTIQAVSMGTLVLLILLGFSYIMPQQAEGMTRDNQPPVIVITSPPPGTSYSVGEDIFFDASGTTDPDGDQLYFSWDFDDRDGIGIDSEGDRAHHSFTEKRIYTVTLRVSDTLHIVSKTIDVNISNYPPESVISVDRTAVSSKDVVHFNGSGSQDADGVVTNYTWDMDDGTVLYGASVEHAFQFGGPYNVTLTVRDDFGAVSSAYVIITVNNSRPVAVLDASPLSVHTGDTVVFDASSSYDPDGSITEYFFDFGYAENYTGTDSTYEISQSPFSEHSYSAPGVYHPRLRVTDNKGTASFWFNLPTTITVTLWFNTPPNVTITEPANGSTVFGIVHVVANVTDIDGQPIVSAASRFKGSEWHSASLDGGEWTCTLDSNTVEDGMTTLEFRAFDGYDYGYGSVVVLVNNSSPSKLIVSAAASKDTVYPGQEFYINGTVNYDRGDAVEDGSADIIVGSLVYMAPVSHGHFSKKLSIQDSNETVVNITVRAYEDMFNISGSTSVHVNIATSNLSITNMDVWAEHLNGKIVSTTTNPAIDGETVRISARVKNTGSYDTDCTVVFREGDDIIRSVDTTITAGSNAEITADYVCKGGAHTITINITETEPPERDNSDDGTTLVLNVRYYANLIVGSVKTSSTEVKAGDRISISVTVTNVGDIKLSCSVELNANSDGTNEVVGTKDISDIYPGDSKVILFEHMPRGKKVIYTAKITSVSPYETDISDNEGSCSIEPEQVEKKQSTESSPIPAYSPVMVISGVLVCLIIKKRRSERF